MDDWLDRAACLNLSTLFHSTDDEPQRVRLTRERRALAVCGSCEVLTECRQAIDAAPADPYPWSVAAGMTASQRSDRRHNVSRLFDVDVVVRTRPTEHGEAGWTLGCPSAICEHWALGGARA